MTKIKVRFKGDNPNSGYGFYQAGDVGAVVGYTQGLAVVLKEDGTFVKAELSHIVEMEEDVPQEPKQDTSELTEFEKELCILVNSYDYYQNEEQDKFFNKQRDKLLSIARKQLQPEFDKELERAYKNADEVQFQRGYEAGYNFAHQQVVDNNVSQEDIEQLVDEYQFDGHPCDFQVKAYKQGIERVVKFIKEK